MTIRQGFTVEVGDDVDRAFAFAAEHGFDYCECNMASAFQRDRVDPEAVREAAEANGIDLLVHLPYRLDACSPHEHVRDGSCRELEAAIDCAFEMGATAGVMHAQTFVNPEKWDGGTIRESVHEAVRRVHEYGAERGFTVYVENLKDDHYHAGTFDQLFAETDASMCLDTGHAHATGHDADWQATLIREAGDRIGHVHLNESRRDGTDEHLPVGLGRIDFEAIATAIRETDWSGTCTHEIFHPSGPDGYVAESKRRFDDLLADDGV